MLDDIEKPDIAFTTGLISAFMCRRETLSRHLSDVECREVVNRGELKPELLPGDVRVVVAEIPELAALAISRQLGVRLLKSVDTDAIGSANSLVTACSRMTLGDVIGAHALAESARERGGLPLPVLTALLERPPRKENFAPGAQLRVIMGDRIADLEVGAGEEPYLIAPDGGRHRPGREGHEGMIADMTPWPISRRCRSKLSTRRPHSSTGL